jgi:hypothetical protein
MQSCSSYDHVPINHTPPFGSGHAVCLFARCEHLLVVLYMDFANFELFHRMSVVRIGKGCGSPLHPLIYLAANARRPDTGGVKVKLWAAAAAIAKLNGCISARPQHIRPEPE